MFGYTQEVMAEADPLSRIKSSARRSSGQVAVDVQRDWYQSDLKRDLGLDPESTKRRDAAIAKMQRRANRPRYGLIAFIGLFAFFLFIMARLWWDGALSVPTKIPSLPSKDWMQSRDLPSLTLPGAKPEKSDPSDGPPSYFEPETKASSSQSEAEESDASGADSAADEP
jgi:hypothetical protein